MRFGVFVGVVVFVTQGCGQPPPLKAPLGDEPASNSPEQTVPKESGETPPGAEAQVTPCPDEPASPGEESEGDVTAEPEAEAKDPAPDRSEQPAAEPAKRICPEIPPELAGVQLMSRPAANVEDNGEKIGVTPLICHPVKPGLHTFVFILADGRKKTVSLNVPADARKTVMIRFK